MTFTLPAAWPSVVSGLELLSLFVLAWAVGFMFGLAWRILFRGLASWFS